MQVNHRETELKALETEIEIARAEKTDIEALIHQRETEKSALVVDIQRLEAQKAVLEQLWREKTTEKSKLIAEVQHLEERKVALAEQLEREKTNFSQLEAYIQSAKAQKDQIETQTTQLQSQNTILERANQENAQQQVELKRSLAKLQLRLEELSSQIELKERRLTEVQTELAPCEEILHERQQHLEQLNSSLHALRLQMGQPLWQAALRANLDAAELPLHTDWVLTALEKIDPEATYAFRLEIAARTAQTVVPKGDNASNEARLFTGVIEARRAEQAGEISTALKHLCAGWEAMLSDNAPFTAPDPAAPLELATPEPPPDDLPPFPVPEVMPVPVSSISRNTEVLVSGAWSTLTLKLDGKVIVIDPGGENYAIPSTSPDMIIVTHAHSDHTRHLPVLSQAFPDIPVIMTPETNQLLTLVSTDWQSLHRWVQELPFGTPLDIAGLKITLHPAGHLLGAAMAEIMGDVHILVTGDFSLRPVGSVPPANTTLFQRPYDLVFMEAVHAFDATFPTASLLHDRQSYLVDRVNYAIESGHTRILILAAALGDAQEVYQALCEAYETPAAPLRQYEIYLKGLAWNVAQHYAQAGIWQSRPHDEPSDFPAHSIIICREAEAHALRQQLEQTQYGVIFEPYKSAESRVSTEQNRRYQVDLHTSLEELQAIGQQVQCTVLALYHRETAGSPLEKTLRAAGKQFVNVASADLMRLELK